MCRRRVPAVLCVVLIALGCGLNEARACSTHGTVQPATVRADVFGDLNANGFLNGVLAIEDGFIAPTSSTHCVAGVGLGSTAAPLPGGVTVTTAQIVITNTVTGDSAPLPDFSFSPSATTTSALAAGSGMSTPPGTNPLFAGSQWFGFVAPVDPFTLPTLGRDEVFELLFELQLPVEAVPLAIPVQFAAGEGLADGSPIFTGTHPVTYFTAANPTATFTAVPEPGGWAVWSLAAVLTALAFALPWFRSERRES